MKKKRFKLTKLPAMKKDTKRVSPSTAASIKISKLAQLRCVSSGNKDRRGIGGRKKYYHECKKCNYQKSLKTAQLDRQYPILSKLLSKRIQQRSKVC